MTKRLLLFLLSFCFVTFKIQAQNDFPLLDSIQNNFDLDSNAKNALNLALYYRSHGSQIDSLEKYAEIVIEKAKLENELDYEATAHYLMGFIQFQKYGNFEEAIKHFKDSKEIYIELDLPEEVHRKDSALASMYMLKEDYNEAMKYFDLSIEGARKYNDFNTLAVSYSNLGQIHLLLKEYEVMKTTFNEGLAFLEKDTTYNKRKVEIDLLLNLGVAHLNLDEFEQADSIRQIIESRISEYPEYPFVDRFWIFQIQYYHMTQQEDKSIELAILTLPQLKNQGYQSSEYFTCLYYYTRGNYLRDRNKTNLLKSIDELRINYPNASMSERGANYEYISKLYSLIEEHEQALLFTNKYFATVDSIREESATKEMQELRIQFDLEKNENKLKEAEIEQMKLSKSRDILFICLLIIGLLGISYFLYNEMQRTKDKARLQELEQKMLSLQMNPHFIFNAISSVQNYLFDEGDRAFALKKLGVFSSLIRQMLEYNRKKFISFEQEQEFLENYLDIQQLRYNNSFDYSIEYDVEISPEELMIPPMLIQPLVENSIEHGKVYLETNGHIIIKVRSDKKLLYITVMDNGIGLSNSISNQNYKKESLAIEINQERLQLLYSNFKQIAKMEFINSENSKGTSVRITLPIT